MTNSGRDPRQRRFSIISVLGFGLTGLTALSVVGALWIGLQAAWSSTESLLAERARTTLDLTVERLLTYVEPLIELARGLSDAVDKKDLDSADDDAVFSALNIAMRGIPQVGSLTYVRRDCRVLAVLRGRSEPIYGHLATNSLLCEQVRSVKPTDGLRWLPPYWSEFLGQSVIGVQRPIGEFCVLIASITVEDVSRHLAQSAPLPGQTPFILYGEDIVVAHPRMATDFGTLTAAHPLQERGEIGDETLLRFLARRYQPIDSGPDHHLFVSEGDGKEVETIMYRTLDAGTDRPWYVGTHYLGSLGETEQARFKLVVLFGIGVLVVALSVTFLIGRQLARPVRVLAEAAQAVETLTLERVPLLPSSRIREYEKAFRAFDGMVRGLRDRERIRAIFGRYVPAGVAEELLSRTDEIGTNGARRRVGILFSDIAGFTSVAEHLPPDRLIELLNDYFREVSACVARHDGVVVDFIGDTVFAMFGAPVPLANPSVSMIVCAREIAATTARFAGAQAAGSYVLGHTRIGLHTGEATIGSFGSSDRLKFSAMGDTVNVASRLESANKAFHTRILASGETIDEAGESLARPLGSVIVKGRTAPLKVHEVLIDAPPWLDDWKAAVTLLVSGDPAAATALDRLAQILPADEALARHRAAVAQGRFDTVIELAEK